MFTFIMIVITLIAILMTLLVLLQSGKGGGLAGIASGGATTQILGARQAPDILEKGTWILATVFIFLCILTNFFIDDGGSQRSIIQQQQSQTPLSPGAVDPGPAPDPLLPDPDPLPPAPQE